MSAFRLRNCPFTSLKSSSDKPKNLLLIGFGGALLHIISHGYYGSTSTDFGYLKQFFPNVGTSMLFTVMRSPTSFNNHGYPSYSTATQSSFDQAENANRRRSTSYFDEEEEKKITSLQNDAYYKIFQALYWMAKEEMPSSKINSLPTLIENMGVDEIYFSKTLINIHCMPWAGICVRRYRG